MDKRERHLKDLAIMRKLAREDQEIGRAGPHSTKKGDSGYSRKVKHRKRMETDDSNEDDS